jgi:hypothetical protein
MSFSQQSQPFSDARSLSEYLLIGQLVANAAQNRISRDHKVGRFSQVCALYSYPVPILGKKFEKSDRLLADIVLQ